MKTPYTELHPKAPAIDRYNPKGLIARMAISCICPDTGIEGDFLFSGDSHREKGSRVTPIYPSVRELDIYCRVAGWIPARPNSIGSEYIYESRMEGVMADMREKYPNMGF